MGAFIQTLKNPIGTARLVEGYATIKRARKAGLTDDQIRTIYPDTKKFKTSELDAFEKVADALVQGDARFKRDAFGGDPATNN